MSGVRLLRSGLQFRTYDRSGQNYYTNESDFRPNDTSIVWNSKSLRVNGFSSGRPSATLGILQDPPFLFGPTLLLRKETSKDRLDFPRLLFFRTLKI